MSKVISWVLLGLGAFLLAAAVVGSAWAPGVMKKTPLDVNSTTYLTGNAEMIDVSEGGTNEFPVKVTSVTKTDSNASTDEVVVFQGTTCVVNTSGGETPDCVTGDDDRLVSASEDAFASDRVSGLAVSDQGAFVPNPVEGREGLQNKWPFDAEKKTYPYWDGMLGQTVDAEYVGSDTIDGLEVYNYEVSVSEQPAEVSDGIQGLYSTDKTITIEPKTGSIVDQSQHEVRTLEDGTTLLDLDVSFTDDQIQSGVDEAKGNVRSLNLVGGTVPLVGFILGPILLIAGAVTLLRSRETIA